jgi:hypothetical protein
MTSAQRGRSTLNSWTNSSNLACCCKAFMPGGRVGSFFSVRCMRSCRLFCWGWPGLMRSTATPEPQPPDGKLGEVEQAVGAGEGNAVIGADGVGQAALAKQLFEGGDGGVFLRRLHGFAEQQEARGVTGDGEGIAIAPIAALELALEIDAPERVGDVAPRQRRALGAAANPAERLSKL